MSPPISYRSMRRALCGRNMDLYEKAAKSRNYTKISKIRS